MKAPRDLTIPDSESSAARRVLGAYLKRCVADLLQLPVGRFDSRIFDTFSDVRAQLAKLARGGDAGLVFSILRRPTHSTLLRCLLQELYGQGDPTKLDAWLNELTALVSLDLAAADALPGDGVHLLVHPGPLLWMGGRARIDVDSEWKLGFRQRRLVFHRGDDVVEIALDDLAAAEGPLRVTHPYHEVDGPLLLATADNNPLSDYEAHPDKSGNTIDLGGRPAEEWTRALAGSLSLIDEFLPDLAAEIRLVMQTLVPVGYSAETHLSASYAEAIGTAYLTLHPDPMTMTEALIHEFSHNKINALWNLAPLLENAFEPKFASPVRPDPRPLHGILLAVHAFLPVARLYQLMRDAGHEWSRSPQFARRYDQIVAGNRDGATTLLENAKPTVEGEPILDELGRWREHFDAAS